MNQSRRHKMEFVAIVIGLLTLVAWCGVRLLDSRSRAAVAAADFAKCQLLSQRIMSLQNQSRLAGAQEIPMEELARPIEQAARGANIDVAQSLVRIAPESAHRIGDSSYKEASTQVLLRQVTLNQVISFLHGVSSNGTGLETTNIRLTAPRDQETGNQWTVETTLSYLIYSPKVGGAQGGF